MADVMKRSSIDLAVLETVRELIAAKRPSITIAIPAYGEGDGILPTLDSLWAAMSVLDLSDVPVFLSDSSMESATVDAATSWAQSVGAVLVVDHSDMRRSLKQALNVVIEQCYTDLLLVLVSDIIVPEQSLGALLIALIGPPQPRVAVGVACPDPAVEGLRYRAGAFQLRAVRRQVSLSPPDMRAEGAFWGAWRSFYGDFRFPEGKGSVADDVELAKAVAAQGVDGVTVKEALVYKVPPGSLRDFCLQTRRSYFAVSAKERRSRDLVAWRAFAEELARDPIGAALYVSYRLYAAAFAARFADAAHSETWEPSPTTKRATRDDTSSVPDNGIYEQLKYLQIRVVVAKIRTVFRTISRVRNWPSVLVAYGWSRVFRPMWQTAEMHFALRDGTDIVCRRDVLSVWPVFEIFVDDAYRVGLLRRLLPDEPVTVIDVGAHVGSASVAFSRALRVRSVICTEPSPTSAALLRRNLSSNAVPSSVVEAAVGVTSGSVELVGGRAGSCEARVARAEGPSDATPDRLSVPMVAMSDLLARAGEGPVLVKMDCEGSEYEIVAETPPAAWAPVRAVVLEYHPVAGTGGWQWLVERLTGLGFDLVWHALCGRPGQGTACFVRPESKTGVLLDSFGDMTRGAPNGGIETDR